MKRMAQFRYYGQDTDYNYPSDILTGTPITDACPTPSMLMKYRNISRLNIYTIPGITLYIYYNDLKRTIIKYIIGATGVLNLDLSLSSLGVRGIRIDEGSLQALRENKEYHFILTIIYDPDIHKEDKE